MVSLNVFHSSPCSLLPIEIHGVCQLIQGLAKIVIGNAIYNLSFIQNKPLEQLQFYSAVYLREGYLSLSQGTLKLIPLTIFAGVLYGLSR